MKLIHGNRAAGMRIKGMTIGVAAKESPPFPVEVMVFEEDTSLVLTVDDPAKEYEPQHPIRTMTDIMNMTTHQPGTVVTNGNSWYAVVIDLNSEPICRKQWCEEALERVLLLAGKTGVQSLALPVLGSVHGNLPVEELLPVLLEKLAVGNIGILKHLWLVAPQKEGKRIRKIIQATVNRDAPRLFHYNDIKNKNS